MARPAALPVGAGLHVVLDRTPGSPGEEPPVELPVRLITIQQRLSLIITQLSKVLRVERPTVYAWMAEESSPHPANLERINSLYARALAWKHLCSEPLGHGLRGPVDGSAILELLELPSLASTAVLRRLAILAKARRQKPDNRSRSALHLMPEHNFAVTPEWMAREAVDSLSHK